MKKKRLVIVLSLIAGLMAGGIIFAYVHAYNQPEARIIRRIRTELGTHQYREALNWYYAAYRRDEQPVGMFGLTALIPDDLRHRDDIQVGPGFFLGKRSLWPRLPLLCINPNVADRLKISLGNFSDKWKNLDPDLRAVLAQDNPHIIRKERLI